MLLDPSLDIAQVGYAIGRPYGGAVARNRLRRRLRALMNLHGGPLQPGSYLIGATPGASNQDFDQLAVSLASLIGAVLAKNSGLVTK